jgi:hypothetical protein
MKNNFVPDGPLRFYASEEFQKRRLELKQAVALRYAERLADARFFRRLFIRWQMHREFQRELEKITPSAQSLWCGAGQLATATQPQKQTEAPHPTLVS